MKQNRKEIQTTKNRKLSVRVFSCRPRSGPSVVHEHTPEINAHTDRQSTHIHTQPRSSMSTKRMCGALAAAWGSREMERAERSKGKQSFMAAIMVPLRSFPFSKKAAADPFFQLKERAGGSKRQNRSSFGCYKYFGMPI